MTMEQIAEEMGIDKRNVMALGARIRKTAIRHGYDADAGERGNLATPGQDLPVKGKSTYFKEDPETGEVRASAGWVKTDKSTVQMVEEAQQLIKDMAEDVPRLTPIAQILGRGDSIERLLNLHILTDFHLGMYAWGEETHGDNWNTDIAEAFLERWFTKAIFEAPDARTGFLMQLGDFTHWDSLFPVTPAHRHVLDADSRFRMVQRVAIRSLRRIIAMMLEKYERVVLVMVQGNHDETTAGWLTEMFSAFLEDNPRIEVITDPAPFGAMQHGRTMLGWNHGHRVNMQNLDKVLTGRFPEMYGATQHRYAHIGHFHHRELKRDIKQDQLFTVEMHTTIAAMDAHASNLGYGSARGADVITYDSMYGQSDRRTLTPEMIMATDYLV